MPQLATHNPKTPRYEIAPHLTVAPDLTRVRELKAEDTKEVQAFLEVRPVHTVVMTSWINDNGIVSELNRGKFYGYRNISGTLEGVALIGHSTLVEARSDKALKALAITARTTETPIHLIMSSGTALVGASDRAGATGAITAFSPKIGGSARRNIVPTIFK